MDKAVNICAFFDEAGAEELSLTRLQLDQEVEDYFYQVVGFMWSTLALSIVHSSHDFIHEPMDRNQFKYRARYVSHLLKLAQHLSEHYCCSPVVNSGRGALGRLPRMVEGHIRRRFRPISDLLREVS